MAKRKNNQDETPIRFHTPSTRKGGGAPIPINQPHWKYNQWGKSAPGWIDWVVIVFMLFVGLYFVMSTLLADQFSPLPFFMGLALTVITALFLGRMVIQTRNHKLQHKDDKKEEALKKARRPRRRKDYK